MASSSPLLTIGLSVHNAARELPWSLGSIFAQTLRDWELLVVDDGSTDRSMQILQGLQDRRVHILDGGGQNLGLAARLNQIVREARGKYIARMDADDLMHPARLEQQLRSLSGDPQVDAIGCGLIVLDKDGTPTGIKVPPLEHDAICADPLHGIRMIHSTVVASAEWLRAHPYNERNRTCEDWELWLSTYSTSRFANVATPLYLYREFDSYSLRGYLRGKRHVASLQWRHREQFGTGPVLREVAANAVRAAYNVVCCGVGLRDHLVRRRSQPLTEEARRLAEESIAAAEHAAQSLFAGENLTYCRPPSPSRRPHTSPRSQRP